MEYTNRLFGNITVLPEKKIFFPEGILGLEDYKEFIFVEDKKSPFLYWMLPLNDEEISFLTVDPFVVFQNYELEISDADQKLLKVQDASEIIVYCLVTLAGNQEANPTANLKGPLVINISKNIGKQIVLDNDKYLVKTPLIAPKEG